MVVPHHGLHLHAVPNQLVDTIRERWSESCLQLTTSLEVLEVGAKLENVIMWFGNSITRGARRGVRCYMHTCADSPKEN